MKYRKRDIFKKISDEVYYAKDANTTVHFDDIETLKRIAANNFSFKSRLCTHGSINDIVHEMFIVHAKNTYVRPHMHIGKSESFIIIEGELILIIYDEFGGIVSSQKYGAYGSGLPFYFRANENKYHSIMVLSDTIVVLEVTSGPFIKNETEFPKWAPDVDDIDKVQKYMKKIYDQCA